MKKLKSLRLDQANLIEPKVLIKKARWRNFLLIPPVFLIYLFFRIIAGKPKKTLDAIPYFEVGKRDWGGVSFIWFFVIPKNTTEERKTFVINHETGHIIQAGMVGGISVFLCNVKSACRYWYFKIHPEKWITYYDWWYEGGASELGEYYNVNIAAKLKAEKE